MIEIQNIKWAKVAAAVFFISGTVTITPAIVAGAASPANVRITVEGKALAMPVAPVLVDDRTMVGVRFVGEAVGGIVSWDQEKRQATVTRGPKTVVLTLGRQEAWVNGKPVLMPVAPQLVQERTMVPLRFIAEALDSTVEWNEATRTVNILRKPTAITGLTYSNDVGKAHITLNLSEPPLSITPQLNGNTLSLSLFPAEIKFDQPGRAILDTLTKQIGLKVEGRTVTFQGEFWNPPTYRYSVTPDGTQLVVEIDHSVTGIQFKQNGRIPTVSLSATGAIKYSSFMLDNPPRLVLDLDDAHLAPTAPKTVEVGSPLLTRIRTAPRDTGDLRVVLDMPAGVPADIVSSDTGIQVQFVPRITAVKTEKLQGKTRLTLAGSLPMDARVTAVPGGRQLKIEVPQGRSALKDSLVRIGDGTIDSISLAPGATPTSTVITVNLPYYLGHTVVSKDGDANIVVDLVASPVFGRRIWLDAGHGKVPGGTDDPGSIGRTLGTKEKVVNLAVALELQRRLEAAGATVYMTRTGDEGIDFRDRPALVNRTKPAMDLFISIHHNSTSTTTTRGTETYYWYTNPKSRTAAQLIHAKMAKLLGFPDRNVRTDSFWVIKETQAPSILLELGYLSNPDEERTIASKTYAAKAADAITAGIFDYFWQEIKAAAAN